MKLNNGGGIKFANGCEAFREEEDVDFDTGGPDGA